MRIITCNELHVSYHFLLMALYSAQFVIKATGESTGEEGKNTGWKREKRVTREGDGKIFKNW